MNNNQDNLKEKFKHALISTARAISGDYKLGISENNKNQSSKNIDFFELDNLDTKYDFIRLRAEADGFHPKEVLISKKGFNVNSPQENPPWNNIH